MSILLPEGRALAHAAVDPDPRLPLDVTGDAREANDPLPAGERRAGAAVDGEHGLHRPEHVVLADRPARAARLRALRPRPVARRRLPRGGSGRAAGAAGPGGA